MYTARVLPQDNSYFNSSQFLCPFSSNFISSILKISINRKCKNILINGSNVNSNLKALHTYHKCCSMRKVFFFTLQFSFKKKFFKAALLLQSTPFRSIYSLFSVFCYTKFRLSCISIKCNDLTLLTKHTPAVTTIFWCCYFFKGKTLQYFRSCERVKIIKTSESLFPWARCINIC